MLPLWAGTLTLTDRETLLPATAGAFDVASPYRAQVEAMETLLTRRVRLEALADRRVRLGTAHGLQGAECHVVIASFGIGGSADRVRGNGQRPRR